ncbi:MAG: aguA, partial [Herbinix sp.]|nr:aguA [Herbinix sp.]
MSYNQCWLNYHKVHNYEDADLLTTLYLYQDDSYTKGAIVRNAVEELCVALKNMLGIHLKLEEEFGNQNKDVLKNSIILGCSSHETFQKFDGIDNLSEEGYLLHQIDTNLYILGKTETGLLYGVFELIRRIALGNRILGLHLIENPANHFRMLNHWDNLDGSIERGYAGASFFFEKEEIIVDQRTRDYARIVASVGINAVVINNVNVRGRAASGLITERYLEKLAQMAEIFS